MKFFKAILKGLLFIIIGALILALVGFIILLRIPDPPGKSGTMPSSNAIQYEETHKPEHVTVEVEDVVTAAITDNIIVSEPPQADATQENNYTFIVKKTDVFLNDHQIEYDKNNLDTLKEAIQNELFSATDDTPVILDFRIGDFLTCTCIENAVKSLGIEPELKG